LYSCFGINLPTRKLMILEAILSGVRSGENEP
jgi:hypothetical protein